MASPGCVSAYQFFILITGKKLKNRFYQNSFFTSAAMCVSLTSYLVETLHMKMASHECVFIKLEYCENFEPHTTYEKTVAFFFFLHNILLNF